MANAPDVVSAIRELTTTKQLDRGELLDSAEGRHARRPGQALRPERAAEIEHRRAEGDDPDRPSCDRGRDGRGSRARQVSLEEARFEDPDFQVGDVLEEEVPFGEFGRTAVQAAKQRIIQRVREGERTRIREEFSDKVGELLSGRGAADRARQDRRDARPSSARPRRSSPTASRTTASTSIRATRSAPCSSASRRRPRGRA